MSYKRTSERVTVTKKDEHSFTMSSGWTTGHSALVPFVEVGDELEFVTINFSTIVGCYSYRENRWLLDMSDEDIDDERAELKRKINQDRQDRLEANRAEWAAAETALPQWLRSRLQYFREHGKNFEADGWGYELAIAKAANILYAEDIDFEDESDDLYNREEFSVLSGNQFGFAKALARSKQADPDFDAGGTMAALAPLGSGPYYDAD